MWRLMYRLLFAVFGFCNFRQCFGMVTVRFGTARGTGDSDLPSRPARAWSEHCLTIPLTSNGGSNVHIRHNGKLD
jgi:hypothetical protein